jgi:transforming growth factor-beta-induced protein
MRFPVLMSVLAITFVGLPSASAQNCSSKSAPETSKACSSGTATETAQNGGSSAAMVMAAALMPMQATAAKGDGKDIVDTAVGAGSFNTLVAALKAASLVDALRAEGPFTVFAPNDAAFAKLPKGTVETLLLPAQLPRLQSILTYHVVPGRMDAASVMKTPFLTTLNGQRLAVRVEGDQVFVGGAKVVAANVAASNGVIHVLDGVMLPAEADVVELAAANGNFTTLVAALKAAGLVETLEGAGPFTVFAPTDAAFAKLPAGTVASLLEPANKAKLVEILKLHVVSGRVYSDAVVKAGSANSLQGQALTITMRDGKVLVGKAPVSAADLSASNGVVHVIDEVLLPG